MIRLQQDASTTLNGERRKMSNHLYPLNFKSNSRPLFIVPGSGGKTDMFRLLSRVLKRACSVYGLDMMGTQRGETPLESIEEIAAQNIRWVREMQSEGPYRFIGHSFGAYVMYEMVQQLETAGQKVEFIAVLDQDLNCIEGFTEDSDRMEFTLRLARDYYESFRVLVRPYPDWAEEIRSIVENRKMSELVPCVREFIRQQIPHKYNKIEYCARLINIRHYNAGITYYPTGRINANVIILKGTFNSWGHLDETLGWSAFADKVTVVDIPGNHHNIVKGENVVAIARFLFDHLVEKPALIS